MNTEDGSNFMEVIQPRTRYPKKGFWGGGHFIIHWMFGAIFDRTLTYICRKKKDKAKGLYLVGVTPPTELKVKTLTSIPVLLWCSYEGLHLHLTAWLKSTINPSDTLLEDRRMLIITEHIEEPLEDRGHYALLKLKLNPEYPYLHVMVGIPGLDEGSANITLDLTDYMKYVRAG